MEGNQGYNNYDGYGSDNYQATDQYQSNNQYNQWDYEDNTYNYQQPDPDYTYE